MNKETLSSSNQEPGLPLPSTRISQQQRQQQEPNKSHGTTRDKKTIQFNRDSCVKSISSQPSQLIQKQQQGFNSHDDKNIEDKFMIVELPFDKHQKQELNSDSNRKSEDVRQTPAQASLPKQSHVNVTVNFNQLIYRDPLYRPYSYSSYYNPLDSNNDNHQIVMPRKSSFAVTSEGHAKSGYSHFPIFEPINEAGHSYNKPLSHRLSKVGLNIDENHVVVVSPLTMRGRENYSYDNDEEGDVFHDEPNIDKFGPRFSRITITSRNNSLLPTKKSGTRVQVLPTTTTTTSPLKTKFMSNNQEKCSRHPEQSSSSLDHHDLKSREKQFMKQMVMTEEPPALPSTPVPQMSSKCQRQHNHEVVVMNESRQGRDRDHVHDIQEDINRRRDTSPSDSQTSFNLSSPSPSNINPSKINHHGEQSNRQTPDFPSCPRRSPDGELMVCWSSSSSNMSRSYRASRPSSVFEEMSNGYGFKSWARKSPPSLSPTTTRLCSTGQQGCCFVRDEYADVNHEHQINSSRGSGSSATQSRPVVTYSAPIWSKKELKAANPVLKEPVNVQVISHARRYSIHNEKDSDFNPSINASLNRTHQNLHPSVVAAAAVGYGSSGSPSVLRQRRRSSVLQTVFGSGGNRRFSEDLRNKANVFPVVEEEAETSKVIFFQVFIPFLIAGFGNVGAGLILDYVQHWPVFRATPELFILVASFLGFKGNLEMTLAARLATQANCGQLDSAKAQLGIGIGNIALIQAQATVVAFLAALIAIAINYFKDFSFNPSSGLLILSTSLVTAAITGLFLSLLMVIVTILARKAGVNPDNVSTLLAAFLGDISAVILLAGSAKLFYDYRDLPFLEYAVIALFLLLLPLFLFIARKNIYTHDVVGSGWFPIIIAMVISSIGGLIFDFAVETFQTIAVFQPIINGVGANLVAVQASRISTYLHQRVELGQLPVDDEDNSSGKYKLCQSPFAAFFGKNANVKTARLLLLMSIPGHIIYIVTIRLIQHGQVFMTFPFIALYLAVAILQVLILLYMAHLIVPFLWSKKIDPDNAAIPGIMSCGDLLGTAFLTIAYFILVKFDDPNTHNYIQHVDPAEVAVL